MVYNGQSHLEMDELSSIPPKTVESVEAMCHPATEERHVAEDRRLHVVLETSYTPYMTMGGGMTIEGFGLYLHFGLRFSQRTHAFCVRM